MIIIILSQIIILNYIILIFQYNNLIPMNINKNCSNINLDNLELLLQHAIKNDIIENLKPSIIIFENNDNNDNNLDIKIYIEKYCFYT